MSEGAAALSAGSPLSSLPLLIHTAQTHGNCLKGSLCMMSPHAVISPGAS